MSYYPPYSAYPQQYQSNPYAPPPAPYGPPAPYAPPPAPYASYGPPPPAQYAPPQPVVIKQPSQHSSIPFGWILVFLIVAIGGFITYYILTFEFQIFCNIPLIGKLCG